MAKTIGSPRAMRFDPYKHPLDYPEVMPYFENLQTAFGIFESLNKEYGCWLHAGMEKWVAVGVGKNKWFRKEWRLDINLNPKYFQDGGVFFELTVFQYVQTPVLLAPFMRKRRGGFRNLKRYSAEDLENTELLERDIRAVLDAELVTGKAWEF